MRQHIDFIRHIVRSVMRYTCVTQFSFKPFVNPKSFGGGFTVPRVMHCCHGYTGVFFLSCSFCFWSLKSGRNTKRLPRYTDGINQPIKNTHHFFPRAQRDNFKLIISPQSILKIPNTLHLLQEKMQILRYNKLEPAYVKYFCLT